MKNMILIQEEEIGTLEKMIDIFLPAAERQQICT